MTTFLDEPLRKKVKLGAELPDRQIIFLAFSVKRHVKRQSINSSFFHGCSVGYYIEPTIVETSTTSDKIFTEEIFGPLVTVYVYKDKDAVKTLDNVINGMISTVVFSIYIEK